MSNTTQLVSELLDNFANFSTYLDNKDFKEVFFSLLPNETVIYLSPGKDENIIYNYSYLVQFINSLGWKEIVFGYKFIFLNDNLYLIEAATVNNEQAELTCPRPMEVLIDFKKPEYIGLIFEILQNISLGHYVSESELPNLNFVYI